MSAAKDLLDRIIDDLTKLERMGTVYDVAQASNAYEKALKQTKKWAQETRRAM